MKKKLIIFGTGKIADVIHYYATVECGLEVEAFAVDEQFKTEEKFHGLAVESFDNLQSRYPPSKYDLFVAVGYHNLNKLRETKCREALSKGYELISIVSPKADLPDNVKVGKNCFVMPPSLIHPYVTLGDNVFVWSGAMIGHHSVIKENCWLTSSCNISGNVVMGRNSFVAVNATVGHSVTIGESCFLGANCLVTKDIADKKVMIVESTKPFRLDSDQFLRMSSFSNL